MRKFCTTGELLKLPNQTWLIRGLLPEFGLSLLFGPSGEGKSFVAIDWACCVSTGTPWLGQYPTKQGHVLYIAAEGGQGIKKRVAAWMQHNGVDKLPNITWFLDSLDFREEDAVDRFMERLDKRFTTAAVYDGEEMVSAESFVNIRLVVIDTLSRCFGGEDENASTAMPVFVDKVELFCRQHEAVGLIIHHANATGMRERGHTSLKAAMEASFHCTADKDGARLKTITLVNNKQKDDIDGNEIYLAPLRLALPTLPRDEEGEMLTSLVLEQTERDDALAHALKEITVVLEANPEGLNKTALCKKVEARNVSRNAARAAIDLGIEQTTLKMRKKTGPGNAWVVRLAETQDRKARHY